MGNQLSALRPMADFRILPAGNFRTRDGRPKEIAHWRIDRQIASEVIALANLRKDDFVIDYDHQTLSGKGGAAAGWFKGLEWREGDGLYMTGATWTDVARNLIAAQEYRYLSPVFSFSPETGNVIEIYGVALTNTPALDGLVDLAVASLSATGLSVQAHFETILGDLRQQHSADVFKSSFGIDLPPEYFADPPKENSLAECISKCSEADQAKLNHVFGHLV